MAGLLASCISHHLTERDLFDVAGVVLQIRPRASEGDALAGAVVEQHAVDELGPVAQGKPVAMTEFGCTTYRGAADHGALSGEIVVYEDGEPV